MLSFIKSEKSLLIKTAFAGICVFAIMALSNSVFYIINIMAVFILYFGLFISISKGKTLVIQTKSAKIIALGLVCIACLLLFKQLQMAKAAFGIKVASVWLEEKKEKKAFGILAYSAQIIPFSDQVWITYGNALKESKNHVEAIKQFEKAEQLTSEPNTLLDAAFCHAKLGHFEEAIKRCSTAMNIVPNRIKPRYALMNVYLLKGDTSTAKVFANIIIAQTPKGISKDAAHYKERANELLQKGQ
jgi:O-antigen polymerase